MTSPRILVDENLFNPMAARVAVAAVREAVHAHEQEQLIAPPRHTVRLDDGALVFTTGGTPTIAGFRVYDTFPDSKQDQIVGVWDRRRGVLEGLAIGVMVGALRTGALGALAVDLLANSHVKRCAVLGSGLQARTQLLCASTVRTFEQVAIYSPTVANRNRFADELAELTGLQVDPVGDSASAVEGADVVLCATSSLEPVFDAQALQPGAHVNTLGPKYQGAHELPLELALRADIVATDSPQQIADQGSAHFLAGQRNDVQITSLGAVLAGRVGRTGTSQVTLFLSAGLAGTEPLVAHALLREIRLA